MGWFYFGTPKLKSSKASLEPVVPPCSLAGSPYVGENCWPLEVERDDGNVLVVRVIGRFYVGGGSEDHRILLLEKENIRLGTSLYI